MERAIGHYLGTEIDRTWWRRFRGETYFVRGMGEIWTDATGLWFHRYFSRRPLTIPFAGMHAVSLGTSHSGKWNLGRPILKVDWERDGLHLCAGFIISLDPARTEAFARDLSREAGVPFSTTG